jgi:hypothetical protein
MGRRRARGRKLDFYAGLEQNIVPSNEKLIGHLTDVLSGLRAYTPC